MNISKNAIKSAIETKSDMGYFSYPAAVDVSKQIYLVSQEKLFCWNNGLLYPVLDLDSPVIRHLRISDDGESLSYVSQEHSAGDIYVYRPGSPSAPERITFFDDPAIYNIGFQDKEILFSSAKYSHARFQPNIYSVGSNKQPKVLYKDCCNIASNHGDIVVQSGGYGYNGWHNYQGGAAAKLYHSKKGGVFEQLKLPTEMEMNNCYGPVFVGSRLFFLSDYAEPHIANVYEYDFPNQKVIRRTFHDKFYVKSLKRCGSGLIYSSGGHIYFYDCEKDVGTGPIPVPIPPHTALKDTYLTLEEVDYTDFSVNDEGDAINAACRGKILGLERYPNAFEEYAQDLRHRFCSFITDTKLVFGKDEMEHTRLRFYDKTTCSYYREDYSPKLGLLRSVSAISETEFIVTTFGLQVVLIDFTNETSPEQTVIYEEYKFLYRLDYDISPDLKWLVYAKNEPESEASSLYVYNLKTKEHKCILSNGETHFSPSFSLDGKYIYFLTDIYSSGSYSHMFFEVNFKSLNKIGAICLSEEASHPFHPWLSGDTEAEKKDDATDKKDDTDVKKETKIDFTKLRVTYSASIPTERYIFVDDLGGGKLLLGTYPKKGKFDTAVFEFATNESTTIAEGISSMRLSNNKKHLIALFDSRIRVTKSDTPFNDKDKSYKNAGWCDLKQHGFKVDRTQEWKNILEQIWALYQEKYWHLEALKNWDSVLERALEVLPRIQSRRELNKVIREMIGAAQTSHTYIKDPGDVRFMSHNSLRSLFADFVWQDGYKLEKIHHVFDEDSLCASPLRRPGVKIEIGDTIIAIDGDPAREELPIEAFLCKKSLGPLQLTLRKQDGAIVKTLVEPCANVSDILYNTWVESNRRHVVSKSSTMGYIHIRDMSIEGFRSFKRQYRSQYGCEGLIIDVRGNGGGNVSSLIMQWLKHQRSGWTEVRGHKCHWPDGSNNGKMVILIDRNCGSDGDLFAFQAKELGMRIGTRTWGGVYGMRPLFSLVDGAQITVPEFGHKLDCGLKLENRGVAPDHEVVNTIEALQQGHDLQLDAAIKHLIK